MVFQNPAHSRDPLLTIGTQLGEIVRWRKRISRREARDGVADLLRSVGLSDNDLLPLVETLVAGLLTR